MGFWNSWDVFVSQSALAKSVVLSQTTLMLLKYKQRPSSQISRNWRFIVGARIVVGKGICGTLLGRVKQDFWPA